jgi:hypothetical protein
MAQSKKAKAAASLNNVLLRIVAVFAASALGVIGAGAIAGVELWKAMVMAGVAGVANVVEGLSRAFLDDGNLAEINKVFNSSPVKKPGTK